jgi:hypothetical protein
MQPGKQYVVLVTNGSGAPITIDLDDPTTGAAAAPDFDNAPIAAGATRVFTVKRPNYGAVPTANIALTYSLATSVTVQAYGPLN